MQEIVVRDEVEADHAEVRRIHEAAFGQPAEAHLVDLLRESAFPQVSLVAELAGKLAGHVFLSPVGIEGAPRVGEYAGLAPVGVEPAAQGRGVGSALIREALVRCPAQGWSAVFLLGDPPYYVRFGFVLAAQAGLRYESELFDPHFQVKELEPGALSGVRGWVRYHEAFSDLVA